MSRIATAAARASALAAAGQVDNPFFAHANLAASATPGGTATLPDGAAVNAFSGETFDFWLPDVTATTARLQVTFAEAVTIPFAAISVHNLHELGATVQVRRSTNAGANWSDAGAGALVPADGGPLCWRMATSGNAAADWEFYITGLTIGDPVAVGVAFLGADLVMEHRIYQGFQPAFQQTEIEMAANVSEGGHRLGGLAVGRGSTLQAAFDHLSEGFATGADFEGFVAAFNRGVPFFFGWRPDGYPDHVHYAWRSGAAARVVNAGQLDLKAATFGMRAHHDY